MAGESLRVIDCGRLGYAEGVRAQERAAADAASWREARRSGSDAPVGTLLLLEHDPPVITVSRRPGARDHLLAGDAALARLGIEIAETDRGGDITYHGPGQLVAYPIVDLNALGWGLHRYMREMEAAVIRAVGRFGIAAHRDPCATGVWVGGGAEEPACGGAAGGGAKLCAMGVRVRRWITLHGLALNVTTDLAHFGLIVPCGLAGRRVTSMEQELGEACPRMADVKAALADELAAAMSVEPDRPESASRAEPVASGGTHATES